MKKLLLTISLVLACTLLFAACKKEDEPFGGDYTPMDPVIEDGEALDNIPPEPNVLASLSELKSFFVVESVESMGLEYEYLFHIARRDNCVVQPLMEGVDVSEMEGYASITVTPPTKEGEYSHIAYYYSDGSYNAVIKVYYLTEEEFNVAKIGGIHALNNGNEELVTREKYGQYTIVKYLPDESSYAEIFYMEKYFITIQGGLYTNENHRNQVENGLLDIISFETSPLDIDQVG